jgi:hypothetical protein
MFGRRRLFVSERPSVRQFITSRGAGYGQYRAVRCRPGRQPDRSGRPPDSAPVNRPSLVQAVDGRSVVSTGVGITLVVAGAILRFAVTAMSAHVAGVIVMLAGVVALLLSLLVWGPLSRRRSRSGGKGTRTTSRPERTAS